MAEGTHTAELVSALRSQQRDCAHLGAPFYAGLLERVIVDVEANGPCAQAMRGPWNGDLRALAVPLRFLGALHRLVLDGTEPQLAARWPPNAAAHHTSLDPTLRRVVAEHLERIIAEMSGAPQTNEVGRSAALAGGFLTLVRQSGLPLRMLEIGASAGLNLRWDHYGYDDRGTRWGDPEASLRFDGPYDGVPTPLFGEVTIAARAGCDLHPLDTTDETDRLRLRSFVWPDHHARRQRLDAALTIAAQLPVALTAASAADWLPTVLGEPTPGLTTVVFHSIFWQYLPADVRDAVRATIVAAGDRATAHAPLAWLRYEPKDREATHATLSLRTWPGPRDQILATAGFHGAPITWR